MAEFPALPLWTDAYLADTSHLTDGEHGRYIIMLFHMWRMPMARFPNDDAWLARKFNRSAEVFVSEWKPLMREYMHTDGNWWTQKKMQKVFASVQDIRAKNRVAAKSRWDKQKDPSLRNASKTKTKTQTDKRVRATRWNPDAKITAEWLEHARQARERRSLPACDLLLEAERFENFWPSKSGVNATKLDWHKTWINWALSAKGTANGKPTAHDKFFAAAYSLIADGAGTEGGGEGRADENGGAGDAGRPLLPP